jgi:hypothetical protein
MEHTFPTRTHGSPVVTLSTAGRARISLKHGLGCTKSRRSHLVAAYTILPRERIGGGKVAPGVLPRDRAGGGIESIFMLCSDTQCHGA